MGQASIFVVDDDAAVLRLIAQILLRAGYRVITAPGPEEALVLFTTHKAEIALVVCDVVMPGMNGPDLVERLTVQRPGLPVLFVSGFSHSDVLIERIIDRGLPLLSKPFAIRELLDKAHELTGNGAGEGGFHAGGTMVA